MCCLGKVEYFRQNDIALRRMSYVVRKREAFASVWLRCVRETVREVEREAGLGGGGKGERWGEGAGQGRCNRWEREGGNVSHKPLRHQVWVSVLPPPFLSSLASATQTLWITGRIF